MPVAPPKKHKKGGFHLDQEAYKKHQIYDSRSIDEMKDAATSGMKSNLKNRYVPREVVPERLARKTRRDILSEKDIPEDQLRPNADIVAENVDLIRTCISYQCARFHFPEQHKEDLLGDIALILMKLDNRKLNGMSLNRHVNAFVTEILKRQLYSGKSESYRSYRQFSQHSLDIDTAKFDEPTTDE